MSHSILGHVVSSAKNSKASTDLNVSLSFFLSAYEDRQQSKRQQISSRSWFSSSSTQLGGTVGSLLQKLGKQGKDAAAAKALSYTSPAPLSLVRRRSEGSCTVSSSPGKAPSSNCSDSYPQPGSSSNRVSPDRADLENTDKYSDSLPAQPSEETQDTSTPETAECAKEQHPTEDNSSKLSNGMSLVADYSDSDSDPGK